MRSGILTIFLLLVFVPAASAADDPVEVMSRSDTRAAPAARSEDIAWLSGRWLGTGLGGTAEDIIAPPSDGQMMGMFRHSKADGSVNFYEFYVFAEKDGSLTLRLKHFSPLLSGWEGRDEFVEFPLVAIGERAAYFDGLSYVLNDDGSLTVGVRLDEQQLGFFHYESAD
jgi:hypothetical protein